jgi:Flp pilus assembly protein TadG
MLRAGRRNSGAMIIYFMVAVAVLMALVSLGVDFGRVQLAKTELQRAADAAARYAVTGISDGMAVSRAIAAAAENRADGSPVAVTPEDVQIGHWYEHATPKFDTTRAPRNAVRLTVARTATRKNAVPLVFGSVVGLPTCDVRVAVVAKIGPRVPMGFIGLEGFTVKNNLLSISYDSTTDPSPGSSKTSNSGMVGTNTSITANNNEIAGLVVLGPGATSNLSLPSPPMNLPAPIRAPVPDFSAAPAVNPAGAARDLVVNGNLTLPGGSYYFTSITMENNSSLRFSGPATLYVDGNVTFRNNGEITAYQAIPANLRIRQRGAATVFGGDTANSVEFTAAVDAPQTKFNAFNSPTLKGRATFRSIDVKNNAEFYYDEALQAALPDYGNTITVVK